MNISLNLNSVGFYQITKLAIVPCTLVAQERRAPPVLWAARPNTGPPAQTLGRPPEHLCAPFSAHPTDPTAPPTRSPARPAGV